MSLPLLTKRKRSDAILSTVWYLEKLYFRALTRSYLYSLKYSNYANSPARPTHPDLPYRIWKSSDDYKKIVDASQGRVLVIKPHKFRFTLKRFDRSRTLEQSRRKC